MLIHDEPEYPSEKCDECTMKSLSEVDKRLYTMGINTKEELPELHIYVGVEADDCWEYGKTGNAMFRIPHYKVKVHLDNDTGENVTPTFAYSIGTSIAGQKEIQSEYIHLPKDKPTVIGNADA